MLVAIVVILVILWLLGYAPISGIAIPNPILFSVNNQPITLWNILILLVVGWAISLLPRPLQAVAFVLLLLWILSVLGILTIAGLPVGLPGIFVILIIVALAISLFRGKA